MVLPTASAGLVMDDVLVRMRLLGAETAWGTAPWWDLYTFARPELNAALREAGFHPWWADPAVKMTFFRPLSAATHVLDYALWPSVPALHHLHSVLWYGLSVAAAGALFRALRPAAVRENALAMLLFAVAAPHVATVGWIAARNTLIASVLGCVLVSLHAGGRRLAALAVLVVGLLAGEAMLGSLGYVAAWQAFREPAPWPRRLGALVPYGLVVVVWRVWYTLAGFGAQQSGIYHDPGSDFVGFLGSFSVNLPALLLSRWVLFPVDSWALVPSVVHTGIVVAACVVLPLLGAVLWPLLRADAWARFWAAGMLLSLVPFTATMPMDRLLLFSGLGFAALVARLAVAPPVGVRWACAALLVLHLPVSAAFGFFRAVTYGDSVNVFDSGLGQAPDDADVPGQTFVYVQGTFHRVHYTTLMRATGGGAVPRRSVVLSSMVHASAITRVDADTLEVTPEPGFMAVDLDRIHRRDPTSLSVGDVVSLPDLDAEILSLTADGRPARVAFHFRVPLEDPSLRWLVVLPDGGGFPPKARTQPLALPAIGETITVPAVMPF